MWEGGRERRETSQEGPGCDSAEVRGNRLKGGAAAGQAEQGGFSAPSSLGFLPFPTKPR